MKRKGLIALIIAGVLALGGGTAFAANQIARSNAIGEDAARNFAFVDAGILPENARVLRTEFDFDNGQFVYEIEFISGDTKYEYVIDSRSGAVLGKEIEQLPVSVQPEPTATATPAAAENNAGQPEQQLIAIEEAKKAALLQAGVDAADATFSKAKLEREGEHQVYDVEFFVPGEKKFDYKIDALTGAVVEESMEFWEEDDYAEYHVPQEAAEDAAAQGETAADATQAAEQTGQSSGTSQGTQSSQSSGTSQSAQSSQSSGTSQSAQSSQSSGSSQSAQSSQSSGTSQSAQSSQSSGASQSAQSSQSSGFSQSTQASQSSGPSQSAQASQSSGSSQNTQVSKPAATPTPTPQPTVQPTPTPQPTPAPTAAPVKDIGVEKAKSIALSHAGVSAGSVVFSKARQDRDDGVLIYDIEFYVQGVAEYEYEIDAATGSVRDYDTDWWEDDD